LPRDGLTGAAVWYDYTTIEPDRLTLAWAIAADELGTTLANYVEAQALIVGKGRVEGIRAVDHRSARHLEIAARVTVNATGGYIDRLLETSQLATGMPVLKAMNLVTRRAANDPAMGGRLRGGRHLFRVPWMSRATFGTWESPRAMTTPDAQATRDEVAAFIGELNAAFDGLGLTPEDVTLVHRGLVPATSDAGRVTLRKHEQFHDHRERDRIDGLISIAGTKYTTARAVAVRVVDRVLVHLGEAARPSRTEATPLPGAGPSTSHPDRSSHDVQSQLTAETQQHLVAAYGNRRQQVLDLTARKPDWLRRLSGTSPVVAAELVHAARHEMVVHLADAVIRRTPLGALGFPGEGVVADAAAIVGQELGWSEERRRDEVADVRGFYAIR
jgi:glycerol-3-phosphate dehydrogenase